MPGAKPPSTEPEIIPPGADCQRVSRIWASSGQLHTTRIRITPLGPVGFALFVLVIVLLAFAGVALLFGAALVGIAVPLMLSEMIAVPRRSAKLLLGPNCLKQA
jgi:hypothetical protein